jgi:hypothetical protein
MLVKMIEEIEVGDNAQFSKTICENEVYLFDGILKQLAYGKDDI